MKKAIVSIILLMVLGWSNRVFAEMTPLICPVASTVNDDDPNLPKLIEQAKAGQTVSQNLLGRMYLSGQGVERNPVEAVKWYRMSAEQGSMDGQYYLALCLYDGTGVVQNKVEAVKWFEKSANQGHYDAMYMLGLIMISVQDYTTGIDLMRKAAKIGSASAVRYLKDKGLYDDESKGVQRQQQLPVANQNKPSTETVNSYEWVDLGLSVKWAKCNVGAKEPSDYGTHYKWNEIANDWRLPTTEEFRELKFKCDWTWTSVNGHNGYIVKGPNGNSIFLPAGGYRAAAIEYEGSHGNYWLGTVDSDTGSIHAIMFDSNYVNFSGGGSSSRYTVRPVRK